MSLIIGHNRKHPTPLDHVVRFISKVRFMSSGCWEWKAQLDKKGYAVFSVNHLPWRASRFSFLIFNVKLDPKLDVDHICRNHACVNPRHLRQLTRAENVLIGEAPPAKNARKTHCVNGHPFNVKNTLVHYYNNTGKPSRRCRVCAKLRERRRRGVL